MLLRWAAVLIALVCTSGPAGAQGLFTWHAFDGVFKASERLEITLHGRIRTRIRESVEDLDQVRGGTIVRVAAFGGSFVGGYYFQPQHTTEHKWKPGHRFFTGIEKSVALSDALSGIVRFSMERHAVAGKDYNRYRSYARLGIGRGAVAPYLQNEFLAVRQGFHSTRNSLGLRWRVSDRLTVEGGVLYDVRRRVWGGDRFAVVSAVRYRFVGQ
jgi:hypothetical protein